MDMNATHLISNPARPAMYSSTRPDDEITPALFALRDALPAAGSPQSASHSLFAQLRSRYPTGALISELVQVHEGQFVVRALVQVSGTTLATGLATADRVEVAEDHARLRAMEVLGIVPHFASPGESSSFAMQAHLVAEAPKEPEVLGVPFPLAAEMPSLVARDAEPDGTLAPEESAPPKEQNQKEAFAASPQADDFLSPFPGLDASQPASVEMEYDYAEEIAPEAALSEAIEPAKVTVPDRSMRHDPIDLSDAIAQIGTEIERIGWTKKQGSTYLQQTYGKKTRAELTEDELLEFLHYLKALPSKGHPSMSQIPF